MTDVVGVAAASPEERGDVAHHQNESRSDDTSSDQSSLPSDIVQFKAKSHLMDDVECSPIEPVDKTWVDYRARTVARSLHIFYK
uniref:Uncharacterized protein n=1 Tax=Caenorhabditis japonica TaxID=281687 RepID=A0A8R1EEK7_CAEJA